MLRIHQKNVFPCQYFYLLRRVYVLIFYKTLFPIRLYKQKILPRVDTRTTFEQ